jgi:hypothetical protein
MGFAPVSILVEIDNSIHAPDFLLIYQALSFPILATLMILPWTA